MCGLTQSGKTHLITSMIDDIDDIIQPTPDKLIYLYTAEQPGYDKIKQIVRTNASTSKLKSCEFIDCNKGIPTMSALKPKLGEATLLVLDDLMIISASNKENIENQNNLASRDSHHLNTSVIFVCQNLNYGCGKLHNARINSQYQLMFNSLTDTRDVELIASNKKISSHILQKILSDVGKKQYGYVVFDGSPKGYSNTCVRTGILPCETTTIYDIEKELV
jgi:hypothetical protein